MSDRVKEERREKEEFQVARVEGMDMREYLEFNQCRQTNFLSRGKHLLCTWLHLNVDSFDKKSSLELFAYVLRIMLSNIVTCAVRQRSASLKELSEPLTVEEYD